MTVESNYTIAILREVICLKVSRQFSNQGEAKPKQIAPCACYFSSTLRKFQVTARNFDWSFQLFGSVVIVRSNYFGFSPAI